MTENEIGKIVVDSSIQLHRELGPGLFESVYETILAHELELIRLKVRRQLSIPKNIRELNLIMASGLILSLRIRLFLN